MHKGERINDMAGLERIRAEQPNDEGAAEEEAPQTFIDEIEDDEPWRDDEHELVASKTPSVHEMLERLTAVRMELRAYFYGNPPGKVFRSIGSRKRRSRRSRVMKHIDTISEEVEYDNFLIMTKGYY